MLNIESISSQHAAWLVAVFKKTVRVQRAYDEEFPETAADTTATYIFICAVSVGRDRAANFQI